LENDEHAKDRADLAASSFEVRLDLLDSSFEFQIIEFSEARNVDRRVNDFSRLSMLVPRPATIDAEKAIHSILAYGIRGQKRQSRHRPMG
jgi:hypothetical protein